jgi:leucyl aminopeptidase
MHAPYDVPTVALSSEPLHAADADLIIVPVADDHAAAIARGLDAAIAGDLTSALDRGEFRAKAQEIYVARTPAQGWRAARVVFVGGGPRREMGAERFRRMAVAAAQVARHQRRARIACVKKK